MLVYQVRDMILALTLTLCWYESGKLTAIKNRCYGGHGNCPVTDTVTVDFKILIERTNNLFGFSGMVLDLFTDQFGHNRFFLK